MLKIKILFLNKTLLKNIIFFFCFLILSLLAPLFHFQLFTGPIVNSALFLAALTLPIEWAIMLGLLPSLMALSVGTLPAVLAPMIPFIMTSNAILILAFTFLRKKTFLGSIFLASFLKFVFLFSTSSIVLNLIAQKNIAQKISQMLSWPQLLTALAGGLIAWLIWFVFLKQRSSGSI